MQFTLPSFDQTLRPALQHKLDHLTKPLGSLGRLEVLALQLGLIQQRLDPQWAKPAIVVFAGDHGLAAAGVSPYPQAVTAQMVLNFLGGGAAISVLCDSLGLQLEVVDAGVNADLPAHPALRSLPLGRGTANMLHGPAMSPEQALAGIEAGMAVAERHAAAGCTVLGLGEMGIGNTSAAALLMARLGQLPLADCVGRGTGLDDAGLAHKLAVLQQVLDAHPDAHEPLAVLAAFGGFEVAMLVGAFLGAARRRVAVVVDGFIASAALLLASRIAPNVLDYCVFSHCSNEQGHRRLLGLLGGEPLLQLDMRLGEASGAALAMPLIRAALDLLNRMASFEAAGVSQAQ